MTLIRYASFLRMKWWVVICVFAELRYFLWGTPLGREGWWISIDSLQKMNNVGRQWCSAWLKLQKYWNVRGWTHPFETRHCTDADAIFNLFGRRLGCLRQSCGSDIHQPCNLQMRWRWYCQPYILHNPGRRGFLVRKECHSISCGNGLLLYWFQCIEWKVSIRGGLVYLRKE